MPKMAPTGPSRRSSFRLGKTIALALTWDGSRHPLRSLPPAARAFLRKKSKSDTLVPRQKLAELFQREAIDEIRICWIPKLIGGEDVLASPFPSPDSRRIGYRATRSKRYGDILGVTYRRVRPRTPSNV